MHVSVSELMRLCIHPLPCVSHTHAEEARVGLLI